jgi:hypothetical protein
MNSMASTAITPARASQARERMTAAQLRTFDGLLAIGVPRPSCRDGLVEDLSAHIERGVAPVMARWTERSLWLGKSHLMSALRCPGLPVAEAAASAEAAVASAGSVTARPMHQATAVGIVTHRAIQLAHTHPEQSLSWYVEQSVLSARGEQAFAAFWDDAAAGVQSDVVMQSVSRCAAFLDSWPALDPSWAWRFEESMQARVGGVTLSARVDLVLGRPRPGNVQSMLLCDLKTGGLQTHHDIEAAFYALVAALRYGVPPFRSTVYSLSSGTWSAADVTEDVLFEVASKVVDATTVLVDSMTEHGEQPLTPGPHCRFCPVSPTCESADPSAPAPVALSLTRADVPVVPVPSAATPPPGEPIESHVETAGATAGSSVQVTDDHGPFALD